MAKHASTKLSPRLQAALSGYEDAGELSAQERAMFLDSFGDALTQPLNQEKAFWAERRHRGGGVGLDGRGRLMQATPGGGHKPVRKKSRGDI
jgi:hypothetical protein